MVTALSACMLYAACAGFYQAGAQRTSLARLKTEVRLRRLVFAGSWVLALIALVLAAAPQGWERGVPIWLGLLTAAGAASLLIAALYPRWHLPSGVAAGAATLVLAGWAAT